jgi:two-component system CheB/CheR fusion protein
MANKSFYTFFHMSANEVENQYIYEIGNKQWNIPKLRELLETILPKNSYFNDFEVKCEFPHIGTRIILLNARRIHNGDNITQLILLAMEDVTDRKDLEKRKDDFINVAAHELKTPVTTIFGYVQLLMQHLGDSSDLKATRYLHEISLHVNKLLRLMKYLLDTTKVQEGKLEYHMKLFNFSDLLREVVKDFKIISPHYTLVLKDRAKKKVYGDREHLEQVVRNLVSNAIKYSPDSNKIIITTKSDNDTLIVGIQDFGIGISPDEQNRVFERFFRVSSPKGKIFSGLGLGLYVSAEIVKRHNGRIWIESTKGKGSIFYIELPTKKSSESTT